MFVNVEIADFVVLGRACRERTQGCATEERYFDVAGEAMKAEEPAVALDAVERRVPRTAFFTCGTTFTTSASSRAPTWRFQPGIAAMYACTGASPSALAICGLPPDRRTGCLRDLRGGPIGALRAALLVVTLRSFTSPDLRT